MGAKKISWNDSVLAQSESHKAISVPTPHAWDFVKVYREPLGHLMFRGRMDWIGAWLLIQAAADRQTNQVNLTEVGRKAEHDFGWDNDRWRRFVRRLEKEGFVATIDKKNFGNKIGYIHIALIAYPVKTESYGGSSTGESSDDAQAQKTITEHQSDTSARSKCQGNAEANDGAMMGAEDGLIDDQVWLIVDDTDEDES